jgi:hypothetical protein
MPIPPDHVFISAADAGPGAPFTQIECPTDDAEATAEDVQRVAAAALANDEHILQELTNFPNATVNFTEGINVSNSTPNGDAIGAVGNGTGRGITATGGAASGTAGFFLGGGPNGIALEAKGTGTGEGAWIQGGANGAGLKVSAGGGNNPGLESFPTGTAPAARFQVSGIHLNGTQPTPSANPGTNIVHSTNIQKAWATINVDGAGNASVLDGENIASVTLANQFVEVTWAHPFMNANYCPQVTGSSGGNTTHFVGGIGYDDQTTTKTRIYFRNVATNVWVNPQATEFRFSIAVNGRHT